MNVLVVEDNKVVSLIICRIIEELGHTYVLAANGEAALRLFEQRQVDCVIADVELPSLDGFQVARQIKAGEPNTPVLFISGNSNEAYRAECKAAGGDDLLAKPLRPSELRQWLAKVAPNHSPDPATLS